MHGQNLAGDEKNRLVAIRVLREREIIEREAMSLLEEGKGATYGPVWSNQSWKATF